MAPAAFANRVVMGTEYKVNEIKMQLFFQVANGSSQNGTPAKSLLRQQKIEQGELRKSE